MRSSIEPQKKKLKENVIKIKWVKVSAQLKMMNKENVIQIKWQFFQFGI